jgi:hypothetical protein
MLNLVHDATADAVVEIEATAPGIDELCRMAAKEMLAVALLAERRAYLLPPEKVTVGILAICAAIDEDGPDP